MNTQLNSLEQYFEQACEQHPQLQYLKSQWGFDKELISKALQNVGHIFPHYSRHDVSHSKQIIINIERLLGDKIQYLTATDMWLILEAAYSHDIGMVITQKQIEDMNSTAFNDFVQKLALDEKNELSSFAKKWVKDEAVLPQKAKAHDFFHQYIQLLAEWYRRKHPINSANIVINPREEIGLDSSRNELIPKRLFNILAKICKAHGDSFEQMIKELPKAEAGLGTEDCHPLYVACLLRMGDLLDIDDNRFCPVMMAMCSHNLPSLSQAHRDKHLSVQHFRLDSERIEVECACPTPESYEAAFDWFEWLKIEYHNQTQHWDQIVPSKQLGRLPTLMNPKVTIQQPYIIIDEGKKPSFQINKESMLHLIRGTGLYSSRFDSIREILQNAVDSTLHRIWIDHKNRYDFHEMSPISERYLELVNAYKVDVSFEPEDINSDMWVLNVRDNGIGISLNDLRYMLNVGSTKHNDEKQKRLSEMPMWFRPSGAFGIGLQSVFLLADEFYITSYSIIDKRYLRINFHKYKGITIEELNATSDILYGCELNVKIKVERIPKRYSYSLVNDMWKEISNGLKEYDITSSNFRLDFVEVNSIIGKILEFNVNSPVKVNIGKCSVNITNNNKENFYFNENIILSNVLFGDFDGRAKTLFRGQEFSGLLLATPCIKYNVDIYSTTSDRFLSYNREKILPEAKSNICKEVYNVICQYISDKFDSFSESEKQFAALSYFLSSENSNKFTKFIEEIKINESDTLANLMNDVTNYQKKVFYIDRDYAQSFQEEQTIKNFNKRYILDYLLWSVTKNGVFYSLHKERHKKDSYGNYIEKFVYTFGNEDIFPISKDYFFDIVDHKISHNDRGCRLFFPAWGKFRELSIRDDSFSYGDFFSYTSYSTDYIILPIDFRFEMNEQRFFDDSENLVTWIYNNKKQENVSFEKIKELVQELIIELKTILPISSDK